MPEDQCLLIRAGRLLSLDATETVREDVGILVENGRIAAVDQWVAFGDDHGCRLLDARERTVMPGLIDAHTHVVHSGEPEDGWHAIAATEFIGTSALKAARNAARHLRMGVTTIRDLGANDWVDVSLRDAINAGWVDGPRMLVACHGITSPGGHMDPRRYVRPGIPVDALAGIGVVVDGPEGARRAAWEQLMRGADVLKVNATLSEYVRAAGGQCSPELQPESLRAVCEVAHDTGRRVATHCHGGPGVKAALEAGVDTLEHGRFLTDELMDLMVAKGTCLVPTLSPEARRVESGITPGDAAERRWYEMATEVMEATVLRAHERGVSIVAGSDAGMPLVRHGEVAFEVAQLAKSGLPNMTALAAATRVAALALGLGEEIGQVRRGYCADLVVVNGDPERDPKVLQNPDAIESVVRAGRVLACDDAFAERAGAVMRT